MKEEARERAGLPGKVKDGKRNWEEIVGPELRSMWPGGSVVMAAQSGQVRVCGMDQ